MNPEKFYKYVSASTAVRMLETSSARHSSPILFNDPFDVQTGAQFPFGLDSLPATLQNRLAELVVSPTRPAIIENDAWGKSILICWERFQRGQASLERIQEFIHPYFQALVPGLEMLLHELRTQWEDHVTKMRVFCVAEEKDNLLMWSHYAEGHKGVVLEMRVLPDEDNMLCVAEPVQYCSTPPTILTEQDWISHLLGGFDLKIDRIFHRYANSKSEVWAYEKEWRIWGMVPEYSPAMYIDYALRKSELSAVYLGAKIEAEAKARITSAIDRNYRDARIWQGVRISKEYKLEFVKHVA